MLEFPELRNEIIISLGNIIFDCGVTKNSAEKIMEKVLEFDESDGITDFGYFLKNFCDELLSDVDYMPVVQ